MKGKKILPVRHRKKCYEPGYSKPVVLKSYSVDQTQLVWSHPRVSDSAGLRCFPRISISDNFPSYACVDGQGTYFVNHKFSW